MMTTQKAPFKRYSILYRIGLQIEAKLPLRVGKGREAGGMVEPDLPVIKSGQNYPMIPGSTLKGFFRANAQRLLDNILGKRSAELIGDVFGSSEKGKHASCIFFGDLIAPDAVCEPRKHVNIIPETGGARRGGLFEVELVKEGAVFSGTNLTVRNITPSYLGLLYAVKALADDHIIRIGGFKSRGYGAIAITFNQLTILLPGTPAKTLQDGFTFTPPVGTGLKVTLTTKETQVTLKEGSLAPIQFDASTGKDLRYFGTRIEVANPEALLQQLTENLQTHLTTSGGRS